MSNRSELQRVIEHATHTIKILREELNAAYEREERLWKALQQHHKSGDYVALGIATQDYLNAIEKRR